MCSSELIHTMRYRDNAHNISEECKNLGFTTIVTLTAYPDNSFFFFLNSSSYYRGKWQRKLGRVSLNRKDLSKIVSYF